MTMRGSSRRVSEEVKVSLRDFAWPRAQIATLRHSTLPWSDAWTRASAAGSILSPGNETIERGRRYIARDESIIESLHAMAALDTLLRVITIRGGSIVRYGALDELRPIAGDDFDIARIAALPEH